jgi:hypothetical protein
MLEELFGLQADSGDHESLKAGEENFWRHEASASQKFEILGQGKSLNDPDALEPFTIAKGSQGVPPIHCP